VGGAPGDAARSGGPRHEDRTADASRALVDLAGG